MDTSTLTLIIQSIVQIITILGGMWAIFNKKTTEIEEKLDSRLINLENQIKLANSNSNLRRTNQEIEKR